MDDHDRKLFENQQSILQRWLIMPKMLYFTLHLFVNSFQGVLAFILIKSWQITYYQFGFANSITAVSFFGALFWSSLAAKTGRYKTILCATAIGYTATILLTCLSAFEGTASTIKFISLLAILGFSNFFLSASFPLLDSRIIAMLESNPNVSKDQFGNQRLFGSVGTLVATLISFKLFDSDTNKLIFFQIAVTLLFMATIIFGIPDTHPNRTKYKNINDNNVQIQLSDGNDMGSPLTPAPNPMSEQLFSPSVEKHPIIKLLTHPEFLIFMLFVSSAGLIRSTMTFFQKIILASCKTNNGTDTGIKLTAIQAGLPDIMKFAGEVSMYLGSKHIKRYLGIYWVLMISQMFAIIRLIGYGLVSAESGWLISCSWGFELLKGFNSGLFSSSAIPIASDIAPCGCEGPAQGLFSGNYGGLSMAFGGIIGGLYLWSAYDPINPIQATDTRRYFIWISIFNSILMFSLLCKYTFWDRVMGIPGFPRKRSMHQKFRSY